MRNAKIMWITFSYTVQLPEKMPSTQIKVSANARSLAAFIHHIWGYQNQREEYTLCIGGDRDILPAERESRHNAIALDERMNALREVRAQPTLQRSEVFILSFP